MNKKLCTIASMLLASVTAFGQLGTAKVQIVHNSPDEAAASVDIFVNGNEALSNVDYRSATAFIDLPAGILVNVGIAVAGNNNSVVDTVANFPLTLNANENYYVIADGIVGQNFGLNILPGARTTATSDAENVDFLVYHGSIDAPAVDVFVEEANTNVAEDLSYGSFSGYTGVGELDCNVQIRDQTSSVTVASYEAPFESLNLAGSSVLVMASGYLSPGANDSAFSLFAVLADGTVQELPTASARAQIIHNSEAAGTVDIWVNNVNTLQGVEYRTATGYIDLPVGLGQTVAVTAAGASDTIGAPINATLNLLGSQTYIVVADGDVANQSLGLNIMTDARETATSGQGNDFVVYHGSVDAPSVDAFVEEANTNVAEDLAFGSFSAYAEVANADYNVQVRDETSSVTVAAYEAPLAALNLDGQSLVVMASGYLSPGANDSAFSLFAVLADGTVQELPTASARAQIIHNSEAAGTVDIWVNNVNTLQGVDFRTATGYLDLPVGLSQSIAITATGAADTVGAAIQVSLDLEGQKTYVVVADGDVANQPLGLNVYDMARESATSGANNTDVLIYHGGSDAPTVDVVESDLTLTLSDDLSFGQFEAYNELATANYTVAITTDDQSSTVASYSADLEDKNLQGQSIVVIASGYLSPTNDEPAFGLFVAVAGGGALIPLQELTPNSVDLLDRNINIFPNPVVDQLQIVVDDNELYNVEIIDITGKQVYNGQIQNNAFLDMSGMQAGSYIVRLSNENDQRVVRVIKK
jgi:hypothetical protein